jgi:hypothetical protein
VRARAFLKSEPGTDLRQLEFRKNQYGPLAESIVLRWSNGLFLPIEGADYTAASKQEKAKNVFMMILKRFRDQNRKVTANHAAGYAPKVFADEPEAKAANLTKGDFALAMTALLNENRIQNVEKDRGHELVIVGEQMSCEDVP